MYLEIKKYIIAKSCLIRMLRAELIKWFDTKTTGKNLVVLFEIVLF